MSVMTISAAAISATAISDDHVDNQSIITTKPVMTKPPAMTISATTISVMTTAVSSSAAACARKSGFNHVQTGCKDWACARPRISQLVGGRPHGISELASILTKTISRICETSFRTSESAIFLVSILVSQVVGGSPHGISELDLVLAAAAAVQLRRG
jgi:hypothetical protein